MEPNNVSHHIGILFTPVAFDKRYIDYDAIDELINDLDYTSLINEVLTDLYSMSISDTMDEQTVVEEIEKELKANIDEFNSISNIDDDEMFYLWYGNFNRIYIERIVPGAYYKINKRYEHEESIEEMINEIVNNLQGVSSVIIIIFKVFITIKGVPIHVFHNIKN